MVEDAVVEAHHLLHQRQLEVQARLVVGALDAAELQQQRGLAFADHEHAVEAEQHQDDDEDGRVMIFMAGLPLVGASLVTVPRRRRTRAAVGAWPIAVRRPAG